MNRISSKLNFLTIIFVLLAVVLAGCGNKAAPTPELNYTPEAAAQGDTANSAQEVAVLVNGQPIMTETFNRELARFEAGQVALGFEVADQASYEQQVLDLLIEQELIRQTAAAQGIVVSDDEVNAVIADMKAENGEEYFNGWLAANYYTAEEFHEVIRLDLITNRLLAPVMEAVPTVAEHAHARHILVNTQAEADEALARLQAGEDFAALAAEYSVDVTTRDTGGDLGWFPRGGLLVPEVEETTFGLQPGQISNVVSSAWGYHIIQTLEFDPNREIEYETRQRLIEHAIENWRLSLHDSAVIDQKISLTS